VVFLSYFQGYTHKEISGILDQPLGTVKTHMRSALKKLKESMGASQWEAL
jgi:RNA polymerase sigma-70 factor (ECF subfamily)